MSFIDNLEWRYATKKFDSDKKVLPDTLKNITKAIRQAPSSFGLQPYVVYIIDNNLDNQKMLQAIMDKAWNQPQIITCSHLLVFCSHKDLTDVKNEHFELLSGNDPDVRASLTAHEQMVTDFLPTASPEWAKKQVYIALGFALAACAELEIDSCPMEGFETAAVSEILKLPETQDLCLLLPIGYRAASENPRPKIRQPEEKLFINL